MGTKLLKSEIMQKESVRTQEEQSEQGLFVCLHSKLLDIVMLKIQFKKVCKFKRLKV